MLYFSWITIVAEANKDQKKQYWKTTKTSQQ